MPRQIAVSQPPAAFRPVTIVINSQAELANLLGALVSYGRGEVYAENNLKKIGLGAFYSGNVRKAARETATAIAGASGVVPMPEFSDYLGSVKFRQSHPSTAGAAVLGTDEDLAVGRTATQFEAPPEGGDSNGDGFYNDDEDEEDND